MKEDLPYFTHDNNARNHPKMKALIAEYGYEGYGRFWALNERIAETSTGFIDISRKVNKLDLAKELGLNSEGLDSFLMFLSDPEIDLINLLDNKISTDRINELHQKVENYRNKKRKKMTGQNGEMTGQNGEMTGHFDTEYSRVKESKGEDREAGSYEPPFSVPENTPNPKKDMTEPIELANLLLASHRKEFPDYLSGKDTEKITEKWAEDIEKLIRIDKKTPENIRRVILWVKEPGNFWFCNIESGKKLREKFERLYEQMIIKKTSPPIKNERANFTPSAEQTDKMLEELARSREKTEDIDLSSKLKQIARGKL